MSQMRETCGCGAVWEGGSAYVEEREKFREAHTSCRQPQHPQPGEDRLHRVEIDFDFGGNPGVRLVHPKDGDCVPGEGETEGCWLTDWLENEGAELLRGKLTLPVRWEVDGDHPLFHLQPSPHPGEGENRA